LEQELIEHIVRALVHDPEAVSTNLIDGEKASIIELHVGVGDEGRIIGKRGNIAKAMRTILQAAAARSGKRCMLEIVG
jgi:predicted RNA-binding protein YlqC (UPF0109 family)